MKVPFTLILLLLALIVPLQGQVDKPNLNSDAFQRKLDESYQAVSTREPLVTEIEAALLQRIRAMVKANPRQARNMLVDILSDGTPVSAAFNHSMGNIYFSAGEYLNAEIEYNAAIAKHTSYQRAWNGLGLARFRQDDFEGALAALAKSVQLGASDSETYGILGYCHLKLGNMKSAEVAYDLAILNDPSNSEWIEGLGQIYMETERYDQARRVFKQLTRTYPDKANYWLLQANTFLVSESPLKAARCLEVARRLEKVDASAVILLGNIYLNEGLFEQAEAIYLDTLQGGSGWDEVSSIEAMHYLSSRGRFETARRLIERIGQPQADWSRESKSTYYAVKGDLAVEESRLDVAELSYRLVLELEPFHGSVLQKLAQLYIRSGQPEKSIYLLERLEREESYEFPALMLRSQLLIDGEKYREALPLLERAMRLQPTDALRKLTAQIRIIADSVEEKG